MVTTYTAKDIEILEGLSGVRKRPAMYIGGTDNNALHHLVNEIIDNSMDEVVAKYATTININLLCDNTINIFDLSSRSMFQINFRFSASTNWRLLH